MDSRNKLVHKFFTSHHEGVIITIHEIACTNRLQRLVDYAKAEVLRNFKLRLEMEEERGT